MKTNHNEAVYNIKTHFTLEVGNARYSFEEGSARSMVFTITAF
jgi:hypothetical protein